MEQDLNTPRPVIAGGTGATSVEDAARNLKSETRPAESHQLRRHDAAAGVVLPMPRAIGAAPVDKHSFAGIISILADALPAVVTDPLRRTTWCRRRATSAPARTTYASRPPESEGAWTSDFDR